MQLLHASGVPCVPTCDKPCFKSNSSEIQRLLLPLVHPPMAPSGTLLLGLGAIQGSALAEKPWPTGSGLKLSLPVEQDKDERVFARVGPHDREEKERKGLTAEGKGPRQGTWEAGSVDRQKARTKDSSL